VTQHLADHTRPATGTDTARTHRLAVLAMVFAIVVPPVGIVLAVLVLRQTQRVPRDRGLAIGALVVAFLVLIAELLLLIGLTTFVATTSSTAQSAVGSGSAAPDSATGSSAAGTAASGGGSGGAAADPEGVARACGVVMPALAQVRTDVAKVKSPDQFGEVLTQLATTIATGASATTDPTFLGHVAQLSQAFQKGWQDSSNGTAPSAVADELTTAGAPVSRDCTAAGYHP
jgi:hypothetical protein